MMQNSFLIHNNIITLKCVFPGPEMSVSLWEVIKYKEKKELFLVLEAGQCISHYTLVPGNHLHSSLPPFQRGCQLLPAQYDTPTLSQVKINCKAMKNQIHGICMCGKTAALA